MTDLIQSILDSARDRLQAEITSAVADGADLGERVGMVTFGYDDEVAVLRQEVASLKARLSEPKDERPVSANPAFAVPQITMPVTIQQDTAQIASALLEMVEVQRERDAAQKAFLDNFTVPTPQVTIEAPPPVVIPAPMVQVDAPAVTVNMEKATLPQKIEIVSMPDRVATTFKEIKRDYRGLIEEVREKTVDEDA